jgi:Holliday junction resolvase RusA-like endonuclease
VRLTFTIRALPIAQPRQRVRVVRTKVGRTFAQNYTPTRDPVNAFKASLQQAAAEVFPGPLLDRPLAGELLFVFPRPANLVWKKRAMPRQWHGKRPDAENVAKAVMDALTNVVWKDDAQVAQLLLRKVYAAGEEAPSVTVSVEELAPIDAPCEPEGEQGGLFDA